MKSVFRVTSYRDDLGRVVEEACEVTPGAMLPGAPAYFSRDVAGVRTPHGMMPVEIRVPCPGCQDVFSAFATIGDETYQARAGAEVQAELAKREAAVRRQQLAMPGVLPPSKG